MRLLIKGATLVDGRGELGVADVLVAEGRIVSLEGGEADRTIEAEGRLLLPGFLDLHAHLRTPGEEQKESLETGLLAAAAGGFVEVVMMPNTKPPLDRPEAVRRVLERARRARGARALAAAALTKGQEGRELAELALLAEAGAAFFTDDGRTNEDAGVIAEGLRYAAALGRMVAVHAEDAGLRGDGVAHECALTEALGLPGNPAEAESARIARDLEVLRMTGGRLHIQHLSTRSGVRLVAQAKERGLRVSAEATPHHLTLTVDALKSLDPLYKVAPPLREEADREALIGALAEGVVDAVATDHAPHTLAEKEADFLEAPFGIPSLEVAFPLLFTELVEKRGFPLPRLVEAMADGPRRLLGRDPLRLEAGAPADLVLVDPRARRPVDPARFYSKARYSPWAGWELVGWPVLTLVGGEVVVDRLG